MEKQRLIAEQVHDLSMEPTDPTMRTMKTALHEDLRSDIKHLPKNLHHDDYIIVNVGPSIVPAYLPSFRIFQYNITDYSGPKITDDIQYTTESWNALKVPPSEYDAHDEDESVEVHPAYRPFVPRVFRNNRDGVDANGKRRHHHRHPEKPDCSKPENKEKYACRPWGPRHASPDSPSRTNRLWSLLGYAQYYLPDVAEATEKKPPKFKLEYVTHAVEALRPPNTTDANVTRKWIPPVPKHLLPKSLRQENRTKSKFAPYTMDDLTIPSWIELATRLGKSKKMWQKFLGFMYMGENVEGDGKKKKVELVDGEEGWSDVQAPSLEDILLDDLLDLKDE
ncbi:686_t:CDS:1 [Acaulospora colombiana]|uniref:686_t:CDS:1 n=1 Tax=Acaulospora colombiana TaxID=27376 RepID=A0ACA9NUU0_9GLOM|nr:686_t:CDS:1 [Acaulospora colombiana]